jgi:hypothetical protein
VALGGVSLLKNGKKRQREGIASVRSLGGTGGGSSNRPLCFVGEGRSEGIPGVDDEAIRDRGEFFGIDCKEGDVEGRLFVEGRTSFDLDLRTYREEVATTSVTPCGSLAVGDGALIGAAFGGGCGASLELVEPVDSRRLREVKGRNAFMKNWPMRVRCLTSSSSSSGSGSGWTVDFHNIRSHLS